MDTAAEYRRGARDPSRPQTPSADLPGGSHAAASAGVTSASLRPGEAADSQPFVQPGPSPRVSRNTTADGPELEVRRRGLVADLRREAGIREAGAEEGYLARVRAAALRFRTQEAASGDIRASVTALEAYVSISALPPSEAPNPPARMAKRLLRKAMFFGLHHLADQTSALGWATVWLGTSVAERVERLEGAISATDSEWRRQITDLRARLDRLETERGGPT